MQLIQEFEKKFIGKNKINFNIGDTVKVHTKIIEGEKERIQVFTGIVIAIKGSGISKTFTVYRSAYGGSMERVFLINSPRITKIQIERKGKVRRSKLYHLRGKSGKKAKVKEQLFKKEKNKAIEEEKLQSALIEEPTLEKELKEEVKEAEKEEAAKKEPIKEEKKAVKKPKAKKEEKKAETKIEEKTKEEKPKKKTASKKPKEEDKPKEE